MTDMKKTRKMKVKFNIIDSAQNHFRQTYSKHIGSTYILGTYYDIYLCTHLNISKLTKLVPGSRNVGFCLIPLNPT